MHLYLSEARSQTSPGRLLPDVWHRLSPSLLAGPLHTPLNVSSPGSVLPWHTAPRPHLTLSRTEISAPSHCLEIIQNNNNPQMLCQVHFKKRSARAAPIFPADFACSAFCPFGHVQLQPRCGEPWGGTAWSRGDDSLEHPGVGQPHPWGDPLRRLAGEARLPVQAGSCRQENVCLAASLLAPGEDVVAGRRAPQAQVSTN